MGLAPLGPGGRSGTLPKCFGCFCEEAVLLIFAQLGNPKCIKKHIHFLMRICVDFGFNFKLNGLNRLRCGSPLPPFPSSSSTGSATPPPLGDPVYNSMNCYFGLGIEFGQMLEPFCYEFGEILASMPTSLNELLFWFGDRVWTDVGTILL